MGRRKTVPDADVFAAIRDLMARDGDKAVAFSSVSHATGLAPATLVQRYRSRDGMVLAAMLAAWDALDARADQLSADASLSAKGAGQILKALSEEDAATDMALLAANFRDAAARARARGWQQKVEAALALRLGGAVKGREAAAILFAAWQGQVLWHTGGEKGFRVKDAIKRLA